MKAFFLIFCFVSAIGSLTAQNAKIDCLRSHSVESLSIIQLFDHRNRNDASKLLNCLVSRADLSDYHQGLYVYYSDSQFTTYTEKNVRIRPIICLPARNIQYDREKQTFLVWRASSYISARLDTFILTVNHQTKTYHFQAKVDIQTYDGKIPLSIGRFYNGLLVPKLDPEYSVIYEFKEKTIK